MAAQTARSQDCDAIVIGAGPYGLAVAAHLKAHGIATHAFGDPMSFWRRHMPKGMRLRSPWGASHISDPAKALTVDAYLRATGGQRIEPLPLETFVGYGTWFAEIAVPELDRRHVERIERDGNGFRVVAADGGVIQAPRVVVATGLAHQAFRPPEFARIPDALASHSSDHDRFDHFCGKRVAVVGRGQSACESAVLLNEAGAETKIVCRGPIHWLSHAPSATTLSAAAKARLAGLLATPSGVGPFPLSWLIEFPDLVHRLPDGARAAFNTASLRAGAAGWLRPRFGGVTVATGLAVERAAEHGGRLALTLGGKTEVFDHIVLATGYRTDIARIGLFDANLLGAIACAAGAPVLSANLESNVPGLYFAGASAVASLGPLMRFVAGTEFAARRIARAIAAARKAVRAPDAGTLESSLAA